jgi:hypothetical protein
MRQISIIFTKDSFGSAGTPYPLGSAAMPSGLQKEGGLLQAAKKSFSWV